MVKSGCGSLKSRSKKLYAAFLEDVELVARHSLDEESHHALLELFFLKWEAVETSLEVKTALDSALNYRVGQIKWRTFLRAHMSHNKA